MSSTLGTAWVLQRIEDLRTKQGIEAGALLPGGRWSSIVQGVEPLMVDEVFGLAKRLDIELSVLLEPPIEVLAREHAPQWQGILIHHSVAIDGRLLDKQTLTRWHTEGNGWRDIGYHAVCERVGERYEWIGGRPLHMAGAHCKGKNETHLGVCFHGDFRDEPPPDEQLAFAARHLGGWCVALDIPVASIEGHRDHWATECPGAAFPMERLRDLVAAELV